MKTLVCLLACTSLLAGLAVPVPGAPAHALGVGGRWHMEHSMFDKLPYDDGDIGYGVAYEYRDKAAAWQLGVDWTPDPSLAADVDNVYTPFANLILKDQSVQGGVGVLSSYIDSTDSEWLDPYFQFLLGLEVPLGQHLAVQAHAFYVFEDWGKLGDFEWEDIDFGAWLTYTF